MSIQQVSPLIADHAYSFSGDRVTLSANVTFSEDDLSDSSEWYLQLWARSNDMSDDSQGIKIAQIQIFPSRTSEFFRGDSPVMLPAKSGEQFMMLALAEIPSNGIAVIRKTAPFDHLERFYTPKIEGNVHLDWFDDSVNIQIDEISNPRDSHNLSGTLNLELWALPEKYTGGSWSGSQLAIASVGVIAGGEQIKPCPLTVPASKPESGTHLTLMLREWTSQGFVTRDFREVEHEFDDVELQVIATEGNRSSYLNRLLSFFRT